MNDLIKTSLGVVIGGLALGAFLNLAGSGKVGAPLQKIADYVNKGFAVDL